MCQLQRIPTEADVLKSQIHVMYEGKHIHFSEVDNKPLCSYSPKLCKQRRLNGYAFCIRHVLEDKTAPFRQCEYVAKYNSQRCTNPIPKTEERRYCNSHLQVLGFLPKKERRRKQEALEEIRARPHLASVALNITVPSLALTTPNGLHHLRRSPPRPPRPAPLPLRGAELLDPFAFHEEETDGEEGGARQPSNRKKLQRQHPPDADTPKPKAEHFSPLPAPGQRPSSPTTPCQQPPAQPAGLLLSQAQHPYLHQHPQTQGLLCKPARPQTSGLLPHRLPSAPITAWRRLLAPPSAGKPSPRLLPLPRPFPLTTGTSHSDARWPCGRLPSPRPQPAWPGCVTWCACALSDNSNTETSSLTSGWTGRKTARRMKKRRKCRHVTTDGDPRRETRRTTLKRRAKVPAAAGWLDCALTCSRNTRTCAARRGQQCARGDTAVPFAERCCTQPARTPTVPHSWSRSCAGFLTHLPGTVHLPGIINLHTPASTRSVRRRAEPGLCAGSSEGRACCSRALPFTQHCFQHILLNRSQQLFSSCTARFADGQQCAIPVFDITHQTPLCEEHAKKMDNFLRGDGSRRVQHQPPQRKPRRKTKPPALTKKHKKKRRRALRRPQKPIPPALPQGNLAMPSSLSLPAQAVSIRTPPTPDLSNDELPDDITDIPHDLELNQEDFSDVLPRLPDDLQDFDLFEGKNGELLPTTEEAEELVRALQAMGSYTDTLACLGTLAEGGVQGGVIGDLLGTRMPAESFASLELDDGLLQPRCGGTTPRPPSPPPHAASTSTSAPAIATSSTSALLAQGPPWTGP
ncbi:hypothetical protein ANANG_G00281300 [Anguilla anguilla]|uniref:KANL2-like probable zinc-finger domain-containing protein n=1 Tax=Anguilla anguilla TaxID=7936 RepID=A0A9D3LMX8_ANGAN|nr:hypothetical protein ANANG_G00281300 [Anguilla anguilla]